ncbi:hypothetical protein DNTS_020371 [Danionella cerebrum]|uniref:Uncharacterized protein n=1 Tax=Danionella cerebrum TaxID=2873325 RepID=A0A553Q6W4_9TELE|nr:hypothetical protein DNTS_020371 [Danionella translucida]
MDHAVSSEEDKYSCLLSVGQVSHHSIELIWTSEVNSRRTGPPSSWSYFTLEMKNQRKLPFKEIHKGFNRGFVVENLKAKSSYTFRLKETWPSGQEQCYPEITASTEAYPLNGRHLHSAVLKMQEEELSRVLQSGKVEVDVPDRLDYTPLMMATMKGFNRGVEILVSHGADVNRKNSSGKDRLMEVVKQLRGYEASWSSQDRTGCSALHWAAVDARDNASWTSLMMVCVVTGDVDVASLLISAGADVNAQDTDGKTPLMVAVLKNHEQLVQMLLNKGADSEIQNKGQVCPARPSDSSGPSAPQVG